MFDKCETIHDMLKRLLELSRSFPDHQMSNVIIDVCANKIEIKFRDQIASELYREHKEENISALDRDVPSRNPLLINVKQDLHG